MSESQVRDTIYDMTPSERRALDDAALNVAVAKATGWRIVLIADPVLGDYYNVYRPDETQCGVQDNRWTRSIHRARLPEVLPRYTSDLNAAWALWGDTPFVLIWSEDGDGMAQVVKTDVDDLPVHFYGLGDMETHASPARALTLAWCAFMQAEKGSEDD